MILHVAFGPEALSAPLGALERPLVRVDKHVDPQVLLLRKRLAAVWLRALKRLCPVVQMQV